LNDKNKRPAIEISNEIGLHGGTSRREEYITYLKNENKYLKIKVQELESEIIVLKNVNNSI
jgi:hypothetical protein